jgi:hypothetical protein
MSKDDFWPYDWQRTEQLLDPRDIERQGLFLLHRGLNIRRTVAFVGSGVSAAYGRASWAELGLLGAGWDQDGASG